MALRQPGVGEEAGLDSDQESRLSLFGGVSAKMEVYAPEEDGGPPGLERDVLETWDLDAEQAVIIRHPSIDSEPFTLTAQEVTECVFEGRGAFVELSAENLAIEGELSALDRKTDEPDGPDAAEEEEELDLSGSSIRADGHVVLRHRATQEDPEFAGRGEIFVLEDGETGRLQADPGKRVHVTGVLPGDSLPYKMTASVVHFTRESVRAENVVIEPLDPLALAEFGGVPIEKLQADSLVATEALIRVEGNVTCDRVGFDDPIEAGFLEIDPAQIKRAREEEESGDGDEDQAWAVPAMPPFERGGFPGWR